MQRYRNTVLVLGFALMWASMMPATAIAAPIDLNTWAQQGPAGSGNWQVQGSGASVFQSKNGQPTFFVSPGNFINTTFEGKFKVETTSDDDFIGFVFGYQTPIGTGTNYDFLLFDWKQGNQGTTQGTASEGLTLSRVLGSSVNLWGHTGTDITVLDTDYGSTRGWADNTLYDFTLTYQTSLIQISIQGGSGDFATEQTIFDVAGSFQNGRFGFYNYSQGQVRYQGFTQAAAPPAVPEPSTLLLLGTGLVGLVAYRRRRS